MLYTCRPQAVNGYAQAVLQFLKGAPTDPGEVAAARPPAPAWLPELASALACGDNLASLPSPPPDSWITDVRRVEESSPPSGTEAAPMAAREPRWTVNALAVCVRRIASLTAVV